MSVLTNITKLSVQARADYSDKAIFSNLMECILKQTDAPCSAQAHLDRVLFILSERCSWVPTDPEVIRIVRDAREHMAHYFEEAKKPWPHG
jgi:hypothetical protein